MNKFYLSAVTTFLIFLSFVQIADAQPFSATYTTFNVVGNVSDPTIWAPPGPPPLGTPCSNCQIIIYGTITDDENDLILNTNSQIVITNGATAIVNKWIELYDNTQVIVQTNGTLYVNDEVDLNNGSLIRLADGSALINANNDLGNGPFTGPNTPTFQSGVFYILGGGNFDVTLAGNGIGQQTNLGANFFDPYTINCNPVPACTSGIVYGPAVTTNVSGFVEFAVTTPLPVTLAQFAAVLNSDHTVGVTWVTSQETNSDYFAVQRSGDGSNWQQLGVVKAKGFSSIASNYSFIDPTPLDGTNNYRLKMVDQDGTFQYSKIVTVNLNEKPVPLVVYNNPFTDEIRIKVNTGISDNLSLVLTDMLGKTLLRQNLNTQAGDNFINLYPTGASQGIYVLSIRGNTFNQTVKLLKQ
jgi:Secretion system C-terminal sorting domain